MSGDIVVVRSDLNNENNKISGSEKNMHELESKIYSNKGSSSPERDDEDDFRASKFRGKLVGLDKMLIHRSLSSTIGTFVVDHFLTMSVKNYKGRSYFQKGQSMNVLNFVTGESFDGGCSIIWSKESFSLKNMLGETVAKCFDSSEKGASVLYGTCPISMHDKPLQGQTTNFYRWLQVRIKEDRCDIDLCSEDFYTPLWYAEGIAKSNVIAIISVENDAVVGWVSKDSNWYLKSRRGIDPALFICLTAMIMRAQKQRPDKGSGVVRRTKSTGCVEATVADKRGPERSHSFATVQADNRENNRENTVKNISIKERTEAVKASLTRGKAKVRAGSTMAFKVVKGAVVLPFRGTSSQCSERTQTQRFSFAEDIWVGPEDIIKNRFLSKKDDIRTKKIIEGNHLILSLEDMRTCLQKGQRVDVTNASTREPYEGGPVVKLMSKSFGLHDANGTRFAKCLEDVPNQTSIVLGTSPLFGSDRRRKTKKSESTKYFPWLQVKLNEYDMSIELWSGHSYTPLWFCENIRESIEETGKVDVMSSENDEKIGEISTQGQWNIKSNAGIDPSLFVCLAVVLMRFKIGDYNNRGAELRRNSSKVFHVVNGAVLTPFQEDCMDASDSEDEASGIISAIVSAGVWVGPDDVIKNRCLSEHTVTKVTQASERPLLKIAFEDDPISCTQSGGVTIVIDSETGEPYLYGSTFRWSSSSFELTDYQDRLVATCLEDIANLTSLVCGTTPLFLSDESIGRGTDGSEYFPWLQVKQDGDDLLIDMWSGHGYTELWFCEGLMQSGFHEILSAEFDNHIGKIRHTPEFESISGVGVDPALFVCLTAVVCRFIQANRRDNEEVDM
jgi:hypothetical protein